MSAVLIAAVSVAGLTAGWPQRVIIARLTGPVRPMPTLVGAGCVTALLFAGLAWRVHPWPVLAAAMWLVLLGVPLAFVDIKVHRLPDVLTWSACAGVAGFLTVAAADTGRWPDLGRSLLGGAVLAGAFLMLRVVSRHQVGLGDVKAAAPVGTALAWLGWAQLLAGALAGFLLGAGYGLVLLSRGADGRRSLAFGPFMLAGAILVVMLAGSGATR